MKSLIDIVFRYSCFIIFLYSNPCIAQYQLYKHVEDLEGSSSINTLCVDQEKYLWIGTESGLYRYDGTTVFSVDLSKFNSSKRVNNIYIDKQQRIHAFIENDKKYMVASVDSVKLRSRTDDFVIVNDSALYLHDRSSKEIPQLKRKSFDNSTLRIHKCGSNYVRPYEDVTIIQNLKGDTLKAIPYGNKYRQTKVAILDSTILYINDKGLIKLLLPYKDARVTTLSTPEKIGNIKFYKQSSGSVLFGYNLKGELFKIYLNKNKVIFEKVYQDPDIINELINSVTEVENGIALGHSFKGLYILNKLQYKLDHIDDHYSSNSIILLNDSINVLTMVNGRPYICDEYGVIDEVKLKFGIKGLNLNHIFRFHDTLSLYYDAQQNPIAPVIICTNIPYSGWYRKEMKPTGKYRYLDNKGRLWRGDQYITGFCQDGKFHQFPAPSINKFRGSNILYITQISTNTLALAYTNGLYVYHIDSNKYQAVPEFTGKETRYIYPLNDTIDIVCTYGYGMYAWVNNAKIIPLPNDKRNKLTYCHYVFSDSLCRLWLPTNNGILLTTKENILDYINKASNKITYYDLDQKIEYNGGSQSPYTVNKNGKYFIPSTTGVVVLSPNDILCHYPKSIPEIKVLNIIDTVGNTLSSNTRHVKVYLSMSPYWGSIYNKEIEYKLTANSNDEWIPVDPYDTLHFLNLPNGIHTIHLRQRSGLNNKDYIYSSLDFYIKLKWYQHLWVKVVFALAFIYIALLYIHFRQKRLIKANAKLEAEVEKATASLNSKNTQLENTLFFRNRLIKFITHDIAGNLSFLNKTIKDINKTPIEHQEVKDETLLALQYAVEDLKNYSNNIITWMQTQIDRGESFLEYQNINLKELILEIWDPISHDAKSKNNNIEIDDSCNIIISTDSTVLGIIAYNALQNANKFMSNGNIYVDLEKEGGYHNIIIEDTGKGFPKHILDNQEDVKRSKAQDGFGLGLTIIKDLTTLLKGHVTISNTTKGASVVLSIPQ